VRPDALTEMTDGGRQHVTLSKRDRRAAVRMVQDNMKALAVSEPHTLLALKNDIELITLNQLIERYQDMLGKGLAESKAETSFSCGTPLGACGSCATAPASLPPEARDRALFSSSAWTASTTTVLSMFYNLHTALAHTCRQ